MKKPALIQTNALKSLCVLMEIVPAKTHNIMTTGNAKIVSVVFCLVMHCILNTLY